MTRTTKKAAAKLNTAIAGAVKRFAPPESLTVDEWADKHRRLSPESSAEAGPWRTKRTPYLEEPMRAFLLWNFPPAKLRPGSCGCLYLAGVLGCVPLCIGYAELSIPLALPFWAEGGMVLLQILYHRITGRPLFRAAPLHRWLEARGAGPVTVFYWLCALGVCGLALALAFVR